MDALPQGSAARKLREPRFSSKMNSAPAYSPEPQRRKSFEVVPGGAPRTNSNAASETVLIFAKILIAVVLVFAFISVFRISLSSATVALAIESKTLDTQIEDARDAGSALEVQQSSLANPSRIKSEASSIGMSVPSAITYLDMSGDIVTTDANGNLSLAGSVNELVEAHSTQ